MDEKKHVKFQGRLVFVGFGSIGQGTLPLILRHIDMPRDRITILTADDRGQKEAKSTASSSSSIPSSATTSSRSSGRCWARGISS